MLLAVASTLSLQASSWTGGCCLRQEATKTPRAFQLRHRTVGFHHNAAAMEGSGRCSIPRAPGGCRMKIMYTNRPFQRMMARSNRSRREPSDAGSDMEDDGEEDGEEEDASAGQVMFEENLEIMMRAAMDLFRKYSARAIRAIREILPPAISTELIAFGVKGVFCIGTLWVFKALLEAFCSIATYVFAGLLVVRLAWSLVVSAQPGDDSTWSPRGE